MRLFPGERGRVSGMTVNPENELAYRNFVAEIKKLAQKNLMSDLGFVFTEEPKGLTDEELNPIRAKNNEVMEGWVLSGKAQAFNNVFEAFANGVEGKKLLKSGDKEKVLDVMKNFLKNERYDLAKWTDKALDSHLDESFFSDPALNLENDVEATDESDVSVDEQAA